MNSNKHERLGLYKNKITDKLVLIFTCYKNNYLIELSKELLEEFMQNRFSIKQLIKLFPL